MGRTLNYNIKKISGRFSRKDHETMLSVSNFFNSGKFENIWTCENFYVNPYDYYPNWNKFKDNNVKDGWEVVNKRYDELEQVHTPQIDLFKQLHKEKLILWMSDPNSNEIHRFTKTQGNELNSLLVYTALIEISKRVKDCEIKLGDEGRFLYCDVIIKDGKAKVNLSELKDDIQRWLADLAEPEKLSLVFYDLPEILIKDLNLRESLYKDSAIGYIQNLIDDLNELYKAIKPYIKSGTAHYLYNLQNQWFDPYLLCRPVKIEDFEDSYEGGA